MAGISFHSVLLSCVLPHTLKITQHFLLIKNVFLCPYGIAVVSVNTGHTNVSARRWKNKKKVKMEHNGWISSWEKCKQTLPLKVEQYSKGNRNWRRGPLKSKFFSSTLRDTILSVVYLGRNHYSEKKTNDFLYEPQDIEHEQQCYDSPVLLLKKIFFSSQV